MFGVCICAWAGHVTPASSATIAAVTNCLIGCSLSFGRYIPPGKRVRQAQLGEALKGDRRLKVIGPAGFLGLQPVLPDRTAFGAATKHQPDADQANHDCPPPQHGRSSPRSAS